jgi:hypothetical protein
VALALILPVLALGLGKRVGLGLTLDGPGQGQTATSPEKSHLKSTADETARQVTMFAILATPGPVTVDPRLGAVKVQLRKILPGHGFKLLGVETERIETGESVTCDLGHGYKAETSLVRPLDEKGKVQLRCNLILDGKPEFSTLVKSPVNQLFFYERSLRDGKRVVIGVGARDIMKVETSRKQPRTGAPDSPD